MIASIEKGRKVNHRARTSLGTSRCKGFKLRGVLSTLDAYEEHWRSTY
jgi:hypothetical protein